MPDKRAWRKLVKKLNRKKRRQKAAQERDATDSRASTEPSDEDWLRKQQELHQLERCKQEAEELAWLKREEIAQRQFRLDRAKREQEEAALEALRQKEFEESSARANELRRQREVETTAFEETMQRMQRFLDSTDDAPPPQELRLNMETRPGDKLCEFYERTNSCRFGSVCTCNHRRPMLSKILLIRHFFTHPLLQPTIERGAEYAEADEELESSEQDLCADYEDFFDDVTAELGKFGEIVNFRAVRNILAHLRGHIFVEYTNERSALNAFVNLQGRYYASKRLNVEFSNLKTWRGAICGLSLKRKCPKGFSCGYIHLFRNPENKYNTLLDILRNTPNITPSAKTCNHIASTTPSWNDMEPIRQHSKIERNWRWSESPESESNTAVKTNDGHNIHKENDSDVQHTAQKRRSRDRRKGQSRSREHYSHSKSSNGHHSRECSSREQLPDVHTSLRQRISSEKDRRRTISRSRSRDKTNEENSSQDLYSIEDHSREGSSKEQCPDVHSSLRKSSSSEKQRKRNISRSRSRDRSKKRSRSREHYAHIHTSVRKSTSSEKEKPRSIGKSSSRDRKKDRSRSREYYSKSSRVFSKSSSSKERNYSSESKHHHKRSHKDTKR